MFTRPAIRVRNTGQPQDDSTLLANAKRAYTGVTAIKVLRSKDIELIFKDSGSRDKVYGQPPPEGLSVLQKEYPVEIPGVPLSFKIPTKPNQPNNAFLQKIVQDNRKRLPAAVPHDARWIHAERELEKRKTEKN